MNECAHEWESVDIAGCDHLADIDHECFGVPGVWCENCQTLVDLRFEGDPREI